MLALPPETPARNQSGCGETVKLLKETAAKPQEKKKKKNEEERSSIQSHAKQSEKNAFINELINGKYTQLKSFFAQSEGDAKTRKKF